MARELGLVREPGGGGRGPGVQGVADGLAVQPGLVMLTRVACGTVEGGGHEQGGGAGGHGVGRYCEPSWALLEGWHDWHSRRGARCVRVHWPSGIGIQLQLRGRKWGVERTAASMA